MPRRNHRRPRWPSVVEVVEAPALSTEDMARDLVHRRLASPLILDPHRHGGPDNPSTLTNERNNR